MGDRLILHTHKIRNSPITQLESALRPYIAEMLNVLDLCISITIELPGNLDLTLQLSSLFYRRKYRRNVVKRMASCHCD